MTARIDQIADALVEQLNAHAWSPAATAAANDLPRYTMAELATPRITVVTRGRRQSIDTRAANERRYFLFVSIHALLEKHNDQTEIRSWKAVAEDLEDLVLRADADGATCVETRPLLEDDGTYGIEDLAEMNVFLWAFVAEFMEVT